MPLLHPSLRRFHGQRAEVHSFAAPGGDGGGARWLCAGHEAKLCVVGRSVITQVHSGSHVTGASAALCHVWRHP